MAELADVTQLVQDSYSRIWHDWYANDPGCLPAVVTVGLDCTSAGYGRTFSRIVVSYGEGNFDGYDILDADGWPTWKIQLVREMLHECEKKVLTGPTEAGRALFAAHPYALWGGGHGELFYTAICDKATCFGFTPAEFIGCM